MRIPLKYEGRIDLMRGESLMKALVFTHKAGLEVKEVPAPTPGAGQVVLRISNCGICGSDLFLYKSGGLRDGAIMGHEFSGVVESVGEGVPGVSVGDRIIARPWGCGECSWCKKGMENICARRRTMGLGRRDGGFAEFLVADRDMIIHVPERLGLDLASMADQFGSALHGMRTIGFQPGENALVMGAGPIGLCAVMLLKHAGAGKIIVSEVIEERAALAERFGADEVVSPVKQPLASALGKLLGGENLDCILECAGNAAATQQAIQIAPAGCRISLVGMCTSPVTFIPFAVFQKHLTIVGSFGNTQAECRECMDIMASGAIPARELITRKVPMEELPAAFDELMKSKTQIKIMMEIS